MEETPDVVTGLLKFYDFNTYTLLDLGANLSFVTPFLANRFHVCLEVRNDLFEVCTPAGESIVAQSVYRGFPCPFA